MTKTIATMAPAPRPSSSAFSSSRPSGGTEEVSLLSSVGVSTVDPASVEIGDCDDCVVGAGVAVSSFSVFYN